MNAYLFDVDGVLTNSQTRKISNPEVIPLLVSFLQQEIPLGFISGRGLLWLRSNVIKLLEKHVEEHSKKILDLVYVSGEFGGVNCVHVNGERIESVNRDFTIPEEVKRGLHFVAFQYSDYIYIEAEKQTVFTVVAVPGMSEEDFQMRKNDIIETFKKVIASFPDLEIQNDRIAINVRYKKANKKYAADTYLTWLKEKNITPEKYFLFGDSSSDLEMGEEMQSQKLPFTFVFVGEQSQLMQVKPLFPLTVTKERCDIGTLEFLKAQQQ